MKLTILVAADEKNIREGLGRALELDGDEGIIPLSVIATTGTTDTGASRPYENAEGLHDDSARGSTLAARTDLL